MAARSDIYDPAWSLRRDSFHNARAFAKVQTAAQRAVGLATAAGDLPLPGSCEACGREQRGHGVSRLVQWHHWSYLPEHHIDVMPLCRICHRRVHSGEMQEPRTGRWYPPRTAKARRLAEARREAA